MGNGEFQVPGNLKQEWRESFEGSKRVFSNKITSESFQFMVLSELKSDLHISHLIERSIYPIPRTPKIIILNDKAGEISILAQRKVLTLRALLRELTLELEVFKIVREIAVTIMALYKRFGPFGLNERMMGGSSTSEVMAWINETFELCEIQIELSKNENSEQTMITQLVQIIRANTACELFQEAFVSPSATFQMFIGKMSELISLERFSLSAQKTSPRLPSSPQCSQSPKQAGNSSKTLKHLQQQECERQLKRKNNIPNLIKAIKGKKQFPSLKIEAKKNLNPISPHQRPRDDFVRESQPDDNFFSACKVRSLNASPDPKLSLGHNNNKSSLTTNYSLLSFHQSHSTSELLPESEQDQFRGTFGERASQPRIPERFVSKNRKQLLIHTLQSNQHKPTQFTSLKNNQINLGEITFQKDRPAYSYGSLNFHCKYLSESKVSVENQLEGRDADLTMKQPSSNSIPPPPIQNYSVIIHNELESIFADSQQMVYQKGGRFKQSPL